MAINFYLHQSCKRTLLSLIYAKVIKVILLTTLLSAGDNGVHTKLTNPTNVCKNSG